MKKVTSFLIIAVIGLLAFTFSSCKKCKNEDPRARIVNNGTAKASIQIKTSGGNTVNINNVDPGTTSEYSSYAAGTTVFTITIGQTDYVETVAMEECYEYDVTIDANNKITTTAKDRNE